MDGGKVGGGRGAVRVLSDLISWADVSQITSRVGGVQAESGSLVAPVLHML